MKKISLLTSALVCLIHLGLAQESFNIKNEFKERELLIVLYEPNAQSIEKLNKKGTPEEIDKYKNDIKKYNENIKFSFDEQWKDKPHQFMLQSKIEKLSIEDLKKYIIITSEMEQIEKIKFSVFTLNTIYSQKNKKGNVIFFNDSRNFKVNIQGGVPSKSDLFFLNTKIKTYFGIEKQFDRQNLKEILSKKTLLINKDMTKMTASEIKENYKYPFKVSNSDEIYDLSEKKDINSLYFKLDIDGEAITFMIVDCESGKIISRSNLSGLTKVSWNSSSNNSASNRAFFNQKDHKINTYPGTSYGLIGNEIARVYTAKAKLKKINLRHLSSKEKQFSIYGRLMIY